MLTIAIPTYDRNARLRNTLERLLPQLTAQCRVLILDNHSPTPVAETLRETLDRFPKVKCKLVRHPFNIGGQANFLRCFELCETEYMWLLGDDDPPKADAVQTILRHLELHPKAIYFNFSGTSHPGRRLRSVTTHGLDDLLANVNDFGQMIWISVCVYKCAAVRDEIKFASAYVQGICPQFLPVLRSVKREGECHLSTVEIVDYERIPAGESYSNTTIALASMMILDLPWTTAERRLISSSIRKAFLLTPRFVARDLISIAIANGDAANALYWFDQICARVFYFDTGIIAATQRRMLRWLVRYPHFTHRAVKLWRFVLRRPGSQDILKDIFHRA